MNKKWNCKDCGNVTISSKSGSLFIVWYDFSKKKDLCIKCEYKIKEIVWQ